MPRGMTVPSGNVVPAVMIVPAGRTVPGMITVPAGRTTPGGKIGGERSGRAGWSGRRAA